MGIGLQGLRVLLGLRIYKLRATGLGVRKAKPADTKTNSGPLDFAAPQGLPRFPVVEPAAGVDF